MLCDAAFWYVVTSCWELHGPVHVDKSIYESASMADLDVPKQCFNVLIALVTFYNFYFYTSGIRYAPFILKSAHGGSQHNHSTSTSGLRKNSFPKKHG